MQVATTLEARAAVAASDTLGRLASAFNKSGLIFRRCTLRKAALRHGRLLHGHPRSHWRRPPAEQAEGVERINSSPRSDG